MYVRSCENLSSSTGCAESERTEKYISLYSICSHAANALSKLHAVAPYPPATLKSSLSLWLMQKLLAISRMKSCRWAYMHVLQAPFFIQTVPSGFSFHYLPPLEHYNIYVCVRAAKKIPGGWCKTRRLLSLKTHIECKEISWTRTFFSCENAHRGDWEVHATRSAAFIRALSNQRERGVFFFTLSPISSSPRAFLAFASNAYGTSTATLFYCRRAAFKLNEWKGIHSVGTALLFF